MKLAGRVACITGGGSGIGRATAHAFAAEGAAVGIIDLRGEAAERTLKELPGSGHLALAGDVADAAAVAEAFAAIDRAHGRLDVLVNNAGVDRLPGDGFDERRRTGSQLCDMSAQAWTRMLAIHLNGAFLCSREAVKRMLPAGSGGIVNMSSVAGQTGLGPAHYATAKAGLLGLTRSLARELGPRGIRVNAICPGSIDTPMTGQLGEPMRQWLIRQTPLGRVGTPDEVAALALFLASDDGAFITGEAISVGGGIHIG